MVWLASQMPAFALSLLVMSVKDPGNSSGAASGAGANPAEDIDTRQALPPLDFSTFIMSLGSSAMVNLGQIPPPGDDTTQQDLPAAKQIIDILGILEEKTRGNLDDSEARLLSTLLYDLRVHYVDAQSK